MDYSEILAQLTVLEFKFKRDKRDTGEQQCVNISILSENIVENDEVFLAQLATDDTSVNLIPDEAQIIIVDNDCE